MSDSQPSAPESDSLMKEVSTRRSRVDTPQSSPAPVLSTPAAAASGSTTSFADRKASRSQARQSFAQHVSSTSRAASFTAPAQPDEAMEVDEPAHAPATRATEAGIQTATPRSPPTTGLEFLTALDDCQGDGQVCWSLVQVSLSLPTRKRVRSLS